MSLIFFIICIFSQGDCLKYELSCLRLEELGLRHYLKLKTES